MPAWILKKVSDELNIRNTVFDNLQILFVGISYKKNVDDIRESPSIELMKLFINSFISSIDGDSLISSTFFLYEIPTNNICKLSKTVFLIFNSSETFFNIHAGILLFILLARSMNLVSIDSSLAFHDK